MTLTEAAEALGIRPGTLRAAMNRGSIIGAGYKVGARWQFTDDDLAAIRTMKEGTR